MHKHSLPLVAAALSASAMFACSSSNNNNGTPDSGTATDGAVAPDATNDGGTVEDGSTTVDATSTADVKSDATETSDAGSTPDGASPDAGSPDAGSDAGPSSPDAGGDAGPLAATKRVLLLSIDGMHQVDLANWIAAHPTSTLATIAGTGVEYTAAHTTTPSDSFPGMVALASGATPRSAGVYYDDSYDRTLYAPGPHGCNSADGGAGVAGTEVVFDESIDFDDSKLFSGGIDANNLPWQKDGQGNCTHVYPHNFIKVNTIFEVIKFAGGYTAWSDKHPAYEILRGPTGEGIDDLYTPEINSDPHNAPAGTVNGVPLAASLALCDGTTNSLPTAKLSDYTTCEPTVQAYDDTKVQAIINQIDGKLSDGSIATTVPTLFGMNFQAVSVAEKLPVGGYLNADAGTAVPSALLAGAIGHVDASLGKMVAELTTQGLLDSTLIIVTAKHGQSPVDKSRLAMESGATYATVQTVEDPSTVIGGVDATFATPSTFVNPNSGSTYDTLGHISTDDVGILWIQHSSDSTTTASLATALTSNAAAIFANTLPPGTIFASNISSGAALAAIYGDPTSSDPVAAARAPDIFIQPNWGTIYSGSSSKVAEHGGGTTDDTGVLLLVSLPGLKTAQTSSAVVATAQVAPTILQALGISPTKLEGVVKEGTAVLPGLF